MLWQGQIVNNGKQVLCHIASAAGNTVWLYIYWDLNEASLLKYRYNFNKKECKQVVGVLLF